MLIFKLIFLIISLTYTIILFRTYYTNIMSVLINKKRDISDTYILEISTVLTWFITITTLLVS